MRERYRNPVLGTDFSDPDVIRVGEDYYLVASSFNRVPALPLLHSRDLVHWSFLGHALDRLRPEEHHAVPRRGGGVWAPALRHHDGLFWIFFPDPDVGIWVTTAQDPRGPWSTPWLLKQGAGLIDPCPLWDGDQAYLIHAWAKSRSGVNNRFTLHRMSPDGRRLLDKGTVVVDGDHIPGCFTLEGPKLHRRGDWYWIFAPAGGVATGWQAALRSRNVEGPYEYRIVLEQKDGPVNGPHQGAWVDTSSGEEWFLHFQDRGARGRVVHLQPLNWRDDGWPVIGADDGSPSGKPVLEHPVPHPRSADEGRPADTDHFDGSELGLQWTWQANPQSHWYRLDKGTLRLTCLEAPENGDLRAFAGVLGQRFPSGACDITVRVRLSDDVPAEGSAGMAVLGDAFAWCALQRAKDGSMQIVHGTGGSADRSRTDPAVTHQTSTVTVDEDGYTELRLTVTEEANCRFSWISADGRRTDSPEFTAVNGHWTGATVGLFALGPDSGPPRGHAQFSHFEVDP